jgi:hypothetical protein
MVTAKLNPNSILEAHKRIFPVNSIGHIALIRNDLSSTGCSFLPATNRIQTPFGHGSVTGTRYRFSSTVALPTGISSSVDYFLLNPTENTFQIANTLEEALAGIAIDFTDTGTGTLEARQQPLENIDPLPVIVSREVFVPSYSRVAFTFGEPAIVDGVAVQRVVSPPILSTAAQYNFQHWLVMVGGSATVGDATASMFWLATSPTIQTITIGAPNYPLLTLRVKHEPA